MQVAGHWGHGALEEAVDRCQADVLIVQEHADRSDGYYRPILLRHPALKIFVLTEDGWNASVLEFRRSRVVDASPTTLTEAIRRVLQREATPDEL